MPKQQGVLLAGCGGGYDVLACLPLFYRLKRQVAHPQPLCPNPRQGSTPILVNLTFTKRKTLLEIDHAERVTQHLWRVDPPAAGDKSEVFQYFPEYKVSQLLGEPVYALYCDGTIADMVKAYEYILQKHNVHVAYLVDGGCDVLLSGDETELGTPVEDMMHLKALSHFVCNCGKPWQPDCWNVELRVGAVGMDMDVGKGEGRMELVARLEALREAGVLLTSETWSLVDADVQAYREVVYQAGPENTIVQSMVCAALEGHTAGFVPAHLRTRLKTSKISMSDFTCKFVLLDGALLGSTISYFGRLRLEMTAAEVDQVIEEHVRARTSARAGWAQRGWQGTLSHDPCGEAEPEPAVADHVG